MGADEVRVRHPAVVDAAARLHAGLQLLHHVAFLDKVVADLDAGNLRKGQRQLLGFVAVRVDGLGDYRDFLHAPRLQLGSGFDEPLQLGQLLLLVQCRRLKFLVDPLLGGSFIRTRRCSSQCGCGQKTGYNGK